MPPIPPPTAIHWRFLVYFVSFGLLLRTCVGPPPFVPPISGAEVNEVPAHWMIDTTGNVAAVLLPNTPIPSKPLEGQQTNPDLCRKAATFINGGCWVRLADPPPCEAGDFYHAGACWNPQAQRPKVPVSLLP